MRFNRTIIILSALFVSVSTLIFFIPKPTLLDDIDFSTTIQDDHQQLLRLTLSRDDKYRCYISLKEIAPVMLETTLLQEDRHFWQHFGINPWALVKAGWKTYIVHSRRMGASTISMQVARLRFGINSRSVWGKLQQLSRALQLERHYNKQQLLEAYLNLAPYGGNIEGVEAASRIYFNKSAAELTLPDALTLSVIPQHPRARTPGLPQLIKSRGKLFARWVKEHPTDKLQTHFLALPLNTSTVQHLPFHAPHFTNEILAEHRNKSKGIITTLNLSLQTLVSRVTSQYLKRKAPFGVTNAAVMLVDTRDMSIKAELGSGNYFDTSIEGQINGSKAKRSPGSTLKPFIYGLAIDQGLIHPNTVLKDMPHQFGGYNPENFDYDFIGPITAKDALILSRNIPAVDLNRQLKHPSLYELLERTHVSHLKPESFYGLALSLGGAELSMHELVGLYAMLVNDGVWRPLRNRQDQPIVAGEKQFSPEASFLVMDILKDTPRPDANYAIPQSLNISWKTGTSSGFRDAWAIGAFGPYVMAVWIGNFNNQGNPAFVGKNIAAPLFFELIEAIHREQGPLTNLSKSTAWMNLKRIEVCKASGLIPTRYCHEREMSWFIPGKSPIKSDTIFREVAINPDTGLRTCQINSKTRFEVFEFWPSDLLELFKRAGIQRRAPPSFPPECLMNNALGLAPQIISPVTDIHYIINAHRKNANFIPLSAITDADVKTLYWFINNTYLSKTHVNQPWLWNAQPGHYIVRAVDDHGRADARDVTVKIEG